MKATPSVSTADLEAEIDKLVYGLYDLTGEEIGIIEKRWNNGTQRPGGSNDIVALQFIGGLAITP